MKLLPLTLRAFAVSALCLTPLACNTGSGDDQGAGETAGDDDSGQTGGDATTMASNTESSSSSEATGTDPSATTTDSSDDDTSATDADTSATDTTTDSDTSATDTTDSETGDNGCGDTYPEGPYGTEVGSIIADLSFTRETGDLLALNSFHNQEPPALIIFSTASW